MQPFEMAVVYGTAQFVSMHFLYSTSPFPAFALTPLVFGAAVLFSAYRQSLARRRAFLNACHCEDAATIAQLQIRVPPGVLITGWQMVLAHPPSATQRQSLLALLGGDPSRIEVEILLWYARRGRIAEFLDLTTQLGRDNVFVFEYLFYSFYQHICQEVTSAALIEVMEHLFQYDRPLLTRLMSCSACYVPPEKLVQLEQVHLLCWYLTVCDELDLEQLTRVQLHADQSLSQTTLCLIFDLAAAESGCRIYMSAAEWSAFLQRSAEQHAVQVLLSIFRFFERKGLPHAIMSCPQPPDDVALTLYTHCPKVCACLWDTASVRRIQLERRAAMKTCSTDRWLMQLIELYC